METKIFLYWLILFGISFVITKIDYQFNTSIVYFKYFRSWSANAFYFVKITGISMISAWLFFQIIHLIFKDHFMFFSEILNP
ncbi:hypothetical protein C8C83_5078 [Flavobacterium sp. 90]|nr:hypothetical protein C8C82_5424 [Flavobacterium sp. 81]TCK57039.1 hypothetical protein C8C83_5078 [Flavobacterium sp. 90]